MHEGSRRAGHPLPPVSAWPTLRAARRDEHRWRTLIEHTGGLPSAMEMRWAGFKEGRDRGMIISGREL